MRRTLGIGAVVTAVALIASACILNGSWLVLAPAAAPPAPPGVTADPDFADVSCPVEDFCLAVGAVVGDDYTNWVPMAQAWDGAGWSLVDTDDLIRPDFPDATFTERLDHIACRAVDDCVAVVGRLFESDGSGDIYSHVYTWDGADWTESPIDDSYDEEPKDVDCAIGGPCVVWSVDSDAYAMWNGSTWSAVDSTDADGPVSCVGSDFCVRPAQFAGFAEHWNGASWTTHAIPDAMFDPEAVDCSAPNRCLAVGQSSNYAATGDLASATWDGSAWTMVPVPVDDEGRLEALSCARGECLALGSTVAGDRVTVAWNGNKWYPADQTPGGADTIYEDLSCLALACLAVGWSGPPATSTPVAARYEWTRETPAGASGR